MTGGTSQGLFIVVAIVIFGIFTLMAYILFEDTLSPALASMFTEATEQASTSLLANSTSTDGLTVYNPKPQGEIRIHKMTKNSATFSSPGKMGWGEGVYYPADNLDINSNYTLSYDITVLDGKIYRIGGHIETALPENVHVYIDGVKISNGKISSFSGIPFELENNKTYRVEVLFDTTLLGINDNGEKVIISDLPITYPHIFIQPNRGYNPVQPYKVEIENIKVEKR